MEERDQVRGTVSWCRQHNGARRRNMRMGPPFPYGPRGGGGGGGGIKQAAVRETEAEGRKVENPLVSMHMIKPVIRQVE